MRIKKIKLGNYFFEFISVFIAVISAFSLNNWNENRRDAIAEEKILIEIRNGLNFDLNDLRINRESHMNGLYACALFEEIFKGNVVSQDSMQKHYTVFTSGNTLNMNKSGYESLKSRGLEIVKNDSIRVRIIELYDVVYQNLEKFEEEAPMTQIFENYFMPVNDILAPYINYESNGLIANLKQPVLLTERQKKLMQSYIWQIRGNRYAMLSFYDETEVKINTLLDYIDEELRGR